MITTWLCLAGPGLLIWFIVVWIVSRSFLLTIKLLGITLVASVLLGLLVLIEENIGRYSPSAIAARANTH
jgi:hypothetical protein